MFLVHVDSLLGARRECSAASGVCREKVPDPRERSSRTACAEVPHARDASEQRRKLAQHAGAAIALPRGSRISRDLGGSTGPHGSSGTGTRGCARAGRPRRRRFRCEAPASRRRPRIRRPRGRLAAQTQSPSEVAPRPRRPSRCFM